MAGADLSHLNEMRRELLSAAFEAAAFDGWSQATLAAAERDAGLPEGSAALACPGGVLDLLDFWALECDRAVSTELAATDLASMKVRERVTTGVRSRIFAIGDARREAARRAAARLAMPDGALRAGRIIWRASDTIWRAIGDTSTDGNFYSKRTILSGVLSSTLGVWLHADEPEDAWRFLDRRIANVMQFEKTKARAAKMFEGVPSPLAAAAALRYPRRR